MKRLGSYALKGFTVAAGATAVAGVGYLLCDISPLVAKHVKYVETSDWVNFTMICGLALVALVTSSVIAKPFDGLMDRMYPNDLPPKQVV